MLKLHDMVLRNLPSECEVRFVCFTDDATGLDGIDTEPLPQGLVGWWNKLYLFKDGVFPKGDRVLFFDLDTVITGPLDDILKYSGQFAILRDFYRPHGLQSSVMAWEAGTLTDIWDKWLASGKPEKPGGDQEWIELVLYGNGHLHYDRWQDLFPGQFVSYKVHAQDGIPKNAKVVVFHGEPRPHQCDGWVPKLWKIGGGSALELVLTANVDSTTAIANLKNALSLPYPVVKWTDPHDGHAVIVGGAPSLKDSIEDIRWRQSIGQKIFATNNTWQYLSSHGIQPDFHVLLDARPQNAAFVTEGNPICYYASQCHPSVFDAAKGRDIRIWHSLAENIQDYLDTTKSYALIGGGSTVGLKATILAFTLGYREFHLYGMDSSYGESHHAYPQPLNDGEKVLEVESHGGRFLCAPWMVTQVREFQDIAPQLVMSGCTITVHGTGLLPFVAARMQGSVCAADVRAHEILSRLQTVNNPVGAEIGVFIADLSVRLLSRPDLTLYMVDSWESSAQDGQYSQSGDFHAGLTQGQQEECYQKTSAVTHFAGDRARVIRKPSVIAAHDIPDGSLDFVFIDADHSYAGCKADLEAWYPKVKPGGWFSGHDYDNTDFPCFGVKKAVDEFCAQRNLEVELGDNFTWFAKVV